MRTVSDLEVIAIQRSNELLIENKKLKTILKDETKLKSYLQNEIAHQKTQVAAIWNEAEKMSSSDEHLFNESNSLIRLDINEFESSSQEDAFANCFAAMQNAAQKKRFIFRGKSGDSMDTFNQHMKCSSSNKSSKGEHLLKFGDSSMETFRLADNIFFRSKSSGDSMDTFGPPRRRDFTPAISRSKKLGNSSELMAKYSSPQSIKTSEVFQTFSPEQRNIFRARSGGALSRQTKQHDKRKMFQSRSGDAFQAFTTRKLSDSSKSGSAKFSTTTNGSSERFCVSSYNGSMEPFTSQEGSVTKSYTSPTGDSMEFPANLNGISMGTSTPINEEYLQVNYAPRTNSCKRKLNFDHHHGDSMFDLRARDSLERAKAKQFRGNGFKSSSFDGYANKRAFSVDGFDQSNTNSALSSSHNNVQAKNISTSMDVLTQSDTSQDNKYAGGSFDSFLQTALNKNQEPMLSFDTNTKSNINITVTDTGTDNNEALTDTIEINPQSSCSKCQSAKSVTSTRSACSNNFICTKRQSDCKYNSLDVSIRNEYEGKAIEAKDSLSFSLTPNSSNYATSSDFTYSEGSSLNAMELYNTLSESSAESVPRPNSSSKEMLLKCSDQTCKSLLSRSNTTEDSASNPQCVSKCSLKRASKNSVCSKNSMASSKHQQHRIPDNSVMISESNQNNGAASSSADQLLKITDRPSSRGSKSFNSFLWAGHCSDTFGAMPQTDSGFRALFEGNKSSVEAVLQSGDEKETKLVYKGDEEESKRVTQSSASDISLHKYIMASDNSFLMDALKNQGSDNFLVDFFRDRGSTIVNKSNTKQDDGSVRSSSIESVRKEPLNKESNDIITDSRHRSDEFLKLCKMASEMIKSMSSKSVHGHSSSHSTADKTISQAKTSQGSIRDIDNLLKLCREASESMMQSSSSSKSMHKQSCNNSNATSEIFVRVSGSERGSKETLKSSNKVTESLQSLTDKSLHMQPSNYSSYSNTSDTFALLSESEKGSKDVLKPCRKDTDSLRSLSCKGVYKKSVSNNQFGCLSESERGSDESLLSCSTLESLKSLLSKHSLQNQASVYSNDGRSVCSSDSSIHGSKDALSRKSSAGEDSSIDQMILSLLQDLSKEERLNISKNKLTQPLNLNDSYNAIRKPSYSGEFQHDKGNSSKEIVKDNKSENSIVQCSSDGHYDDDVKIKTHMVVEDDTASHDQNQPMTSLLTKHLHKIMNSLDLGGPVADIDLSRALQSIPSINLDSSTGSIETDKLDLNNAQCCDEKKTGYEPELHIPFGICTFKNQTVSAVENAHDKSDDSTADQPVNKSDLCSDKIQERESFSKSSVSQSIASCNSERQIVSGISTNGIQQCNSSANEISNEGRSCSLNKIPYQHNSSNNKTLQQPTFPADGLSNQQSRATYGIWKLDNIPTIESLMERLDFLDKDLNEKRNELSRTRLERDSLSARVEEIECSFHALTDQRYNDNVYLRNSLVRVESSIEACRRVLASTIEQKSCLKDMLDYLNVKINKDEENIKAREI